VQFLLPLMQSSLMPLHETNLLRFTERLLRLSVPNVAHWLVMFYLVFHLWLNILGELLMFGDRLFYKVCNRCVTEPVLCLVPVP
jgi:diacylglycerol O-acyltransferase-1